MNIVLQELGKNIQIVAELNGLSVVSAVPIIWGQPETWPSDARDLSAGRRTAFEVASLLEMGLARPASDGALIPYDSFPEVEAEEFRITTAFTKPSPFLLKIDRSSDVGRPDFKYRYQYLLGATQVPLERVGFYVRRSATREIFRLDERMYALVEAMDKFNCLPPEEKGPQRSWLDFANIKRWSREVDAQLDATLMKNDVVLPSSIGLDRNRLKWKLSNAARHVAAASLAGDNKLLSVWRQKSHEQSNHRRIQGESLWCKKTIFGYSQTGEI